MALGVWGGLAQWGSQDAGITVTGQTANYDYSAIPASIITEGDIVVTGQTANYDYSAINGTITVRGTVKINYKYITRVRSNSHITRVK